jgi:hypothetical protein
MSESMDSDDLAELQNRRLQHAAAVRAAEEAKDDLVHKVRFPRRHHTLYHNSASA